MTTKRILIADGNVPGDRALFTRFNGCAPSGMFDELLRRGWSNIETEILYPTDIGAEPSRALEGYDGILFTGSNSNIYKQEPGTLRQIDFARAAFASGTPVFGVCWGLQLATVALGGAVQPSRAVSCRCEAPFASGIRLSDEGRSHAMHAGRPDIFDAFAFHSDEVTSLPPNTKVTATSEHFIQAAEIQAGASVFWGVQYHPELTGPGMAGFLRGFVNELTAGRVFESADEIEDVAAAVEGFAPEGAIPDHNRHHFKNIDVQRFEFRPLEVVNWVEQLVMRPKGRAKGKN